MLLQGMIQYGHLNPQGLQQDDLRGKELLAYLHNEDFFTYFEVQNIGWTFEKEKLFITYMIPNC